MNIIKAYRSGFKESAKQPQMILTIYVINILLGLIIAIPFFGIIKSGIGQSMSMENIIKQFDYTVYQDFMSNSKAAVNGILSQIKWIALFYLILSAFINGGIIETFTTVKFTYSSFFSGAGHNFRRFLGNAALMTLVQFLIALIVYIPTFLIAAGAYDNASSEVTLYRIVITGIVIHLLLLTLVITIGDYAKFYMVLNESSNIFKSAWESTKYVFKNFLRVYGLFWLLMVIPILLLYLYYHLDHDIGMSSGLGIFFMFIVQQTVIFVRIGFRVWTLSSQYELYSEDFLKLDKLQSEKLRYVEPEIITKEAVSEQTQPEVLITTEVNQSNGEVIKATIVENKVESVIIHTTETTEITISEPQPVHEKIITEAELLKQLSADKETTSTNENKDLKIVVEEKRVTKEDVKVSETVKEFKPDDYMELDI